MALFAGAGGGLLATKWLLGWRTVCYVENAKYPVDVIKARIRDGLLDDAPIWDDARTFDGKPWSGCVDIITAGFPCQPFSAAGKQRGKDDERNMWPDTIRIIREVRPRYALLENVPGLLAGSHGYFGTILGELAESGYDARWRVLSAAEVGAPHKRDRVWIVAYSQIQRINRVSRDYSRTQREELRTSQMRAEPNSSSTPVADANKARLSQFSRTQLESISAKNEEPSRRPASGRSAAEKQWDWWHVEPDVGRVADGVADRVDRLKSLGNGQVPAVVAVVWELLTEQRT